MKVDRVGGPSLYDNLIEPNVIVFMAVVGSYGCLDCAEILDRILPVPVIIDEAIKILWTNLLEKPRCPVFMPMTGHSGKLQE